ncbi:MAG: hypothetical protein NTY08_11645 [Proteobacteria bacterium]|nr:hypothetical protein [Pseudomonadota bacterium]
MIRLALIPLTVSFLSLSACSDPSSAPAPVTAKAETNASTSGSAGNKKLGANDPLGALFGSDEQKKAGETRGQLVGQLNNEVATLYGRLENAKRTCFGFQKEINSLQTKMIMDLGTKTLAGGAVSAIGIGADGAAAAALGDGKSSSIGGAIGSAGTDAFKSLGEGVSGDINKADIKDGVASISGVIGNNMSDCFAYSKNLMTTIAQKTAQINDMNALGTE